MGIDGLNGNGDQVRAQVAGTIQASLRPYDLVIRSADDEFTCAISGLTEANATKRLALVTSTLAQNPEHALVAAGVAELQPDESSEHLVARAGAAMTLERRQRRF